MTVKVPPLGRPRLSLTESTGRVLQRVGQDAQIVPAPRPLTRAEFAAAAPGGGCGLQACSQGILMDEDVWVRDRAGPMAIPA
jgi:hypothetical protein